jgi:hypothetical protein
MIEDECNPVSMGAFGALVKQNDYGFLKDDDRG